MGKLLKLALGLGAIGLLCLVAAYAETPAASEPARRIVVFSESTPAAQRVAIARQSGAKVVRSLRMIHAVVIEASGRGLASAEAQLRSRPEVVRIDESPRVNWLLAAALPSAEFTLPAPGSVIGKFSPSAPPEPPAGGQETPWGIKRVNAAGAWGVTRGQGVKVAVIDTGIDYKHPDLKDNVAGGANVVKPRPPEELPEDGEGLLGINASDDFMDDHSHGTHVSGTIAALDDDRGVVGVAPKASLYGVKVLDAQGSGTFDDVIAGMQWAVDNKMQVANMSLGSNQGNPSLEAAVKAMAEAGVVLVAAAGNDYGRPVGFPAAYPGAIAVTASDSRDHLAFFSSRGPQVAFIAPGAGVRSTIPGGGLASYDGTSMASPHVAGLVALLLGAHHTGAAGVREALKLAATPLVGPDGARLPPESQGAGLIDAGKLVK